MKKFLLSLPVILGIIILISVPIFTSDNFSFTLDNTISDKICSDTLRPEPTCGKGTEEINGICYPSLSHSI